MAEVDRRVRVEQLDWPAVLPWLRLFGSFRMAALDPAKMALALLLVVLVYVGGRLLDAAWPTRALPGEVSAYAAGDAEQFERWRQDQEEAGRARLVSIARGFSADVDRATVTPASALEAVAAEYQKRDADLAQREAALQEQAQQQDVSLQLERVQQRRADLRQQRDRAVRDIRELTPRGIFDVALSHELEAFSNMVGSATALNFGMTDLLRGGDAHGNTVMAALRQMFVTIPGWLYHAHPWFLLFFAAGALAAWGLIGGAIARMAAIEATRDEPSRAAAAMRFAYQRLGWFVLTPLAPLLFVLAIGLVLFIGGLLFNVPVIDMLGGLLFFLALLGGLLIAAALVITAAAVHMVHPALAVEGTDTFDVISRCASYVINRPWHWLFYTAVALVYGAITYLFIGVLVFLTLLFTQHFVNAGVFREAAEGMSRFEAMLPPPQFGVLAHEVSWSALSLPGKVAAALVWIWVFLLVGVLAAYAVNYYLCAHTWIYLLLRQATDGTDYDEVYIAPQPAEDAAAGASSAEPAAPDKVEPSSGESANPPQA